MFRAPLHQRPQSIWPQCCDDACDTVLIGCNESLENAVGNHFGATLFFFYYGQYKSCHKHHHSVDTTLMLTLGVNGPLVMTLYSRYQELPNGGPRQGPICENRAVLWPVRVLLSGTECQIEFHLRHIWKDDTPLQCTNTQDWKLPSQKWLLCLSKILSTLIRVSKCLASITMYYVW